MKTSLAAFLALLYSSSNVSAFQKPLRRVQRSSNPRKVVSGDVEPILEKTARILTQNGPPFQPEFDALVRSVFPNALNSSDFQYRAIAALADQGFSTANTLLVTSLCSDELAKRLTDDLESIYGNSFNLGGLAGFPFAGNIGFQTMSGHIPDGGCCLLVYGPHVGLAADGSIGVVERKGVSVNESCCTSAIKACESILQGATPSAMDMFSDLQQGQVQTQLTPFSDRLVASQYPMLELPYLLFETQNRLVESIVSENIAGVKEGGIALLGGVQINTGPNTLDYFHPLRFDLVSNRGQLVENMLPRLQS